MLISPSWKHRKRPRKRKNSLASLCFCTVMMAICIFGGALIMNIRTRGKNLAELCLKISAVLFLLLLACTAFALSVSASPDYAALSGSDFKFSVEKGQLVSCEGEGGVLIIPESVKNEKITSIDSSALAKAGNVTIVVIPEGVKTIEKNAFASQSMLKNISLPSTLEQIGDSAFAGCQLLEEITIPQSVKSIGKNAFRNCTALEQIVFMSSDVVISLNCFEKNIGLRRIFFDSTVPPSVLEEKTFAKVTTSATMYISPKATDEELKAFSAAVRDAGLNDSVAVLRGYLPGTPAEEMIISRSDVPTSSEPEVEEEEPFEVPNGVWWVLLLILVAALAGLVIYVFCAMGIIKLNKKG